MRAFAHIDFGRERVPDETTICKFRHLIEKCDLSGSIFDAVAMHLAGNGIAVKSGTIVDATILDAPSSTKNQAKERDPEMHQTKKGNQWFFGMKAHVGADSKTRVIHSVVATPANVRDSRMLPDLLHGDETRVWGDAAYIGQVDVIRAAAPKARAFINKRATRNKPLSDTDRAKNRTKSKLRAKGKHPFLVMKRIFPFLRLRYRGIGKNGTWVIIRCALVNLFTQRRPLLRLQQA
jgi:IS5 family transposase